MFYVTPTTFEMPEPIGFPAIEYYYRKADLVYWREPEEDSGSMGKPLLYWPAQESLPIFGASSSSCFVGCLTVPGQDICPLKLINSSMGYECDLKYISGRGFPRYADVFIDTRSYPAYMPFMETTDSKFMVIVGNYIYPLGQNAISTFATNLCTYYRMMVIYKSDYGKNFALFETWEDGQTKYKFPNGIEHFWITSLTAVQINMRFESPDKINNRSNYFETRKRDNALSLYNYCGTRDCWK